MAAKLRLPTLALAALSICLSLAIIGCAGRALNIFDVQHSSNVWLLPLWPNHFDTRELQTLLGTSAAILVLNSINIAAIFITTLPANLVILTTTLLSTISALTAITFPAVLNSHAPRRDTLQSWTCRWTHHSSTSNAPAQFTTICQETRFAFYTTIPIFLLQLLLLSLALHAIVSNRRNGRAHHATTDNVFAMRLGSDAEKSGSLHELRPVQQVSVGGKREESFREGRGGW
ncbi:hypothetical protein B0A50_06682 [Salinomyces thailandicus]|uniref:Uncharacterized protein n=1 Tax=Salinomyces thailandicus TaxID=706561 RepID=A0A4U0TRY3_9PEZI|nr:hypothetical protein B0A50_06682 [Salinomyces thailandica]